MPEARTTSAAVLPPPERSVANFSATPAHVSQARRFLAELLDASPLLDDAVLCLSELATNAVRHSASRKPGGVFQVEASTSTLGVRVEVTDAGGPWGTGLAPACQVGHGLAVVAALSARWGVNGSESGRTVWFEMSR